MSHFLFCVIRPGAHTGLSALERGGFGELWNWRSLMVYVRGIWRGRSLRLPRTDITQLGGDFVLDNAGRIVFAHRSREPADRPSPSAIVDAVRAAAAAHRREQEHVRD